MGLPRVSRADTYDIDIMQGSAWEVTLVIGGSAPLNVTGWAFASKIRESFAAAAAIIDITATVTDEAAGIVVLSLTSAQTAGLSVTGVDARVGALGVWDLEATEAGETVRLLQGVVRLSQEATR